MALPSMAPYPHPETGEHLPPKEWEACLDAWIALAQAHLRLPFKDFLSVSAKDRSLPVFFTRYSRERTLSPSETSKEKDLRRVVFLLAHRLLVEADVPDMFTWECLADISNAYQKSVGGLLKTLWERKRIQFQAMLLDLKTHLLKELDPAYEPKPDGDSLYPTPGGVGLSLRRIFPLLHASPEAASFLMIGSDLLDALAAAYQIDSKARKRIVTVTYLGLKSLTGGEKPNLSLLFDHLYTLQEVAKGSETSLVSDLVTNTPLLRKLQSCVTGSNAARAKPLISSLEAFRKANGAKGKNLIRRKIIKGKSRADDEFGHGAFGDVHVHRMSLVTQVQDLFPDLGSGFVVKLLDEYSDDVEQVTAHLLEDSLPENLRQTDRKAEISHTEPHNANHILDLAPRSTPPLLPSRRNVFDNDDFDQLAIDSSKLHIGRKNATQTADSILSDRSSAPNKAAILSALAAFDSDDDERDDTYDAEDVGGTVDSARPGTDEMDTDPGDKNDEALFSAYRLDARVFERDPTTRRSRAREALKSETGMTDEAIEGWAVMLGRDPRRGRRLEAKFATFVGGQTALASTRYRESPATSGAEDEDGGGGNRGGRGGRGRGRGRGGRGGSVAGSAGEKGTQASSRRGKEANKGSRANHNRRDQRARKMARGGFSG
ncbi:MAG: hypothetical protein M1835_006813 [Candelina submexicana]|nr:MAG: hypothetical protein M1835_006813 [Candelina submexicana]